MIWSDSLSCQAHPLRSLQARSRYSLEPTDHSELGKDYISYGMFFQMEPSTETTFTLGGIRKVVSLTGP